MRNDPDLSLQLLRELRCRGGFGLVDYVPSPVRAAVQVRHMERLVEDGLVAGEVLRFYGDELPRVKVRDLTTDGHRVLDALELDGAWERFSAALSAEELGALGLRRLAHYATEAAERKARDALALPSPGCRHQRRPAQPVPQ